MHTHTATDEARRGGDLASNVMGRLRREPDLRGLVLMAPTRTLAAPGISLDDGQLVQLLEQVEAMDSRPSPVTAHELMTADVVTISVNSSTREAARVLSDNRISALPVLAADGSIAGMLSVYDLLTRPGATVRDVMSRDVASVSETAPLREVRALLVSQHLRRVVVTSAEGRLVGIISLGDLVRELAYR